MGPVEKAVRAAAREGQVLGSVSRSVPFTIGALGRDSLDLIVGEGQWKASIPWTAIEGIPAFLRGRGWVAIGSKHSSDADPDSLDDHLRQFSYRPAGSYLPTVLEVAGVVEVDRKRPASVRVRDGWA